MSRTRCRPTAWPAPRAGVRFAAALLLACSTPTAADVPDVAGAWVGDYVEAVLPARDLGARLQLTQDGAGVRGTVILVNGRAADVSGPLAGRRLSLGLSYTDDCAGTARWVLELSPDGTALTGTAESFDCRGDTRADVTLVRQ